MKNHLLKHTKPSNLAFVGSLNGFHGSFRSEMVGWLSIFYETHVEYGNKVKAVRL